MSSDDVGKVVAGQEMLFFLMLLGVTTHENRRFLLCVMEVSIYGQCCPNKVPEHVCCSSWNIVNEPFVFLQQGINININILWSASKTKHQVKTHSRLEIPLGHPLPSLCYLMGSFHSKSQASGLCSKGSERIVGISLMADIDAASPIKSGIGMPPCTQNT